MMKGMFAKAMETRVTLPVIAIVGVAVVGWKADSLTVSYLDRFFVSEAQAQDLGQRIGELEGKVGGLAEKIDESRIKTIESEVFRLRVEQCMATGELRTLYASQISALVGEWRGLTRSPGLPPTLVECGDLG